MLNELGRSKATRVASKRLENLPEQGNHQDFLVADVRLGLDSACDAASLSRYQNPSQHHEPR